MRWLAKRSRRVDDGEEGGGADQADPGQLAQPGDGLELAGVAVDLAAQLELLVGEQVDDLQQQLGLQAGAGMGEAIQPGVAAPRVEGLGGGAVQAVLAELGLEPALEAGDLAHSVVVGHDQLFEELFALAGVMNRMDEPSAQQIGELVGRGAVVVALGARDPGVVYRVGDHQAAHMGAQRAPGPGGQGALLEHHLFGLGDGVEQLDQALGGGCDLALEAQGPVLLDHRVAAGCGVQVQSDVSHWGRLLGHGTSSALGSASALRYLPSRRPSFHATKYDLLDRVISVKNPAGEVAYYDYNTGGQVKTRKLGNHALVYYTYDSARRVTRIQHRTSALAEIATLNYQYDHVGNPVSIIREDGSATYFSYDSIYQLTAETQLDSGGDPTYEAEYQYDGAHNRTVKVIDAAPTYYTYNEANQLETEKTAAGTTYYHHDGCGNTTAKQAAGGTTYLQYNTENLLTRIDFAGGGHSLLHL